MRTKQQTNSLGKTIDKYVCEAYDKHSFLFGKYENDHI